MTNARANARNRGKVWERDVATRLGTKRTGPTGMDDADIIHDTLGVECKAYAHITLLAVDWQQARDNAKGRVPILAIKPKGNTAGAVAVMEYDYWMVLADTAPLIFRKYKRMAFRQADWKKAQEQGAHLVLDVDGMCIVIMSFDYFVALHTEGNNEESTPSS